MAHKALVIDDDPDVRDEVAEILDSMGHEYDMAAHQNEARQLLATNEYSYFLLDLEIPIRPGSRSRIQNGENLLSEILDRRGLFGPPVIVITGHGKEGPKLARRVLNEGAVDFVNKPFPPTGETLDKAIHDAFQRQAQRRKQATLASSPETPIETKPGPFNGGLMVFSTDCVRLCGVKIISDKGTGQSMMILDELRTKDREGRYVRRSAEELAAAIDTPGGVATVTSCIALLRRNIAERLKKELGVHCGLEEVIARDEQGYHLRDWIIVQDADGGVFSETDSPDHRDSAPCSGTSNSRLNRRQRWAVAEMERGVRLQRKMLERHFRITAKTAKRDFAELRKLGKIEFVRSPSPGYYRLKKPR